MDTLHWCTDFKIGIDELDNQHKQLLVLFNKLATQPQSSIHTELVSEVFQELVDHSRTQFEREEALMQSCNYPKADEHIAEHKEFSIQLVDMMLHYQIIDVRELLGFMRHWLTGHVCHNDQEFGRYYLHAH